MSLVHFNLSDMDMLVQFYSLSRLLYSHDINYAEQTNSLDTKSFLSGYFTLDNGLVNARGVLYRSELMQDGNFIFFIGHFEAKTLTIGIDFLEQFKTMFQSQYKDAILMGPMNGSTWNNYRLASGNVEYLFQNDIVNPVFYSAVFEKVGFRIQSIYYTQMQTSFDIDLEIPEGYKIAYKLKEEWVELLPEICEITMEAFALAPLFTRIEFSEFNEKYLRMLAVLDTALMPLVYNELNDLVGYGVAYLSALDNSMTAKTIARKRSMRYAGVGRILSNEMMQLAKQYAVDKLYHAFMHQQNHSKVLSQKYGAQNVKQYLLYQL